MNRTDTLFERNYEIKDNISFIKLMTEQGILFLYALNEVAESLKKFRKGDAIELEVDFKNIEQLNEIKAFKIHRI